MTTLSPVVFVHYRCAMENTLRKITHLNIKCGKVLNTNQSANILLEEQTNRNAKNKKMSATNQMKKKYQQYNVSSENKNLFNLNNNSQKGKMCHS